MKFYTFLFFIIAFFNIVSSHAIIIDASVWEGPHNQRLYCFGDFHLEQELARKQGIQILEAAAEHHAPLIIENMFDYQGQNDILRDYLAVESLQTLATFTPQNYPLVHNVEHRQEKLFYSSRSGVSGATMLKSVDDVIDEIRNYNDGPVLNAHRDAILETVNIIHEQLRAIIMHSPSYADARAHMQNNKHLFKSFRSYYPEFGYANLKLLLNLYDVHLLDVRMLHEIYQHQIKQLHAPHLFVCAGQFHIESIENLLPELGYTKISAASEMRDVIYATIKSPETGELFNAIDIPAFFSQLPAPTSASSKQPSSDSSFVTHIAQLFSWPITALFG